MKPLLRLLKLVVPLFPVMLLAIFFGTTGFFCAIGIPVFGAMALVQNFPIKFLLFIGIGRGVLHYLEQYCNHLIAFILLARIRKTVFSKLRSLGPARIEGKEKGNLLSLLTSDIELLEVFYAHTISPVCIALLVCAAMVIFIGHYSLILASIALASYLLVGIAMPAMVNKAAVKHGTLYRKEFSDMNSFLLDCLRGISMSIMYTTGNKKLSEIQKRSDSLSQNQGKMAKIEGLTSALSGFFVALSSVTMLFISLALYRKNLIGFESVIICTIAMFSSFGPVIAVANLGSGLSQTIASANRVLAILDEEPLINEVKNGKKISPNGAKALNLSFKYPRANPSSDFILDKFSIDFPKNKMIGIQGKSGSGKSTLLKLFMRFWEANTGTLLISDVDINEINTQNLRKIESYVTQETVLFHDTIAENLRIAKLDATDSEIVEACKKANVHEFIDSLPQKYNTQVAELGENFSGGERQRLGLARAFLHGGGFILLDEPTSNLDSWNEDIIMSAVKEESKEKMIVIVSHRDSTFKLADEVIKIKPCRKT